MATLTINTTPEQDARIAEAFGARLPKDPGENATGAEVRREIINFIKRVVVDYESQKAAREAREALPEFGDV